MIIDLNSVSFRNKVYGCWMGKNCGGTLGAPLEQKWGLPELYDIWWYPKLEAGGIPNDDLEMQLFWLRALEEVGVHLKAADLAQYWLDHIGYNWDEYGISKANLRLGLMPPVSGHYSNWHIHSMGSPIRTELWACVAPGVPSLAVRYAYEDSICDHAGGESIYGAMFNAAIESSAFVISDRDQLLDIGLSYVPEDSKTALAIRTAREAYAAGKDWKEARQAVYHATPQTSSQYSPINMGFEVIGWLYGEDFGDALCKAVNCGYDTDCTGATLGSFLGIILSCENLPARWTEPLGDQITTNHAWGGVRNQESGVNPIPKNLDELTDRVIRMAKVVLTTFGHIDTDGKAHVDPASLTADASVRELWHTNPMVVRYPFGSLTVGVDYGDTPVVVPNTPRSLTTHLENPHPDPIKAVCSFTMPEGWSVIPSECVIEIPANTQISTSWQVKPPGNDRLENSNRLHVSVQPYMRPAQPAAPVVLIGARKYRYVGPFSSNGRSEDELLDEVFAPELGGEDFSRVDNRPGHWTDLYAHDYSIPIADVFPNPGVLYLQHYLWAHEARKVRLILTTTGWNKLWVNGETRFETRHYVPIRIDFKGDPDTSTDVLLKEGWNEVLIKLVRGADTRPAEIHLTISREEPLNHGVIDLGWTRMPWDVFTP